MSKPVTTPWQWQFPPAVQDCKLGEQIRKVAGPAQAAARAHAFEQDSEKAALLLMQCIQHAETALRAIERGFVDLDGAKQALVERNAESGYYGEEGEQS